MGTVAARSELELQLLKFEAPGKALAAFLEVRRHGQETRLALQGCRPLAGPAQ